MGVLNGMHLEVQIVESATFAKSSTFYGKVGKGADFSWSIYAVPHTTAEPRGNLYGPSFAITDKADKGKVRNTCVIALPRKNNHQS